MDLGDGDEAHGASRQRDNFKRPVGSAAGSRRRQLAVTVGKDRRQALVRAKRLRRGAGEADGDEGMALDKSSPGEALSEEEALRVAEGKAVAAVDRLRAALTRFVRTSSNPKRGGNPELEGRAVSIELAQKVWCCAVTHVSAGGRAGGRAGTECRAAKGASAERVAALKQLRQVLSSDVAPPLQAAVAAGAVPLLVQCLGFGAPEDQLLEAAWCVTNIAAGEQSQAVAAMEASALLIQHLGGAAVELVKGEGIPSALVHLLTRGDAELAAEVAWCMVYITVMSEAGVSKLVAAGALPPVVALLAASEELTLSIPLLRTLGNVTAADDSKTDALLSAGNAIPGGTMGCLTRCLESPHRVLQKEGAWVLSNVAGGTEAHKEAVFQGGPMGPLLRLLTRGTFDISKEAAYAVGESGSGRDQQVAVRRLVAVVEGGCLPGFLSLVRSPDPEAARLGLQFVEMALRAMPDKRGPKLVEAEDGIDALESLEYHDNEELRSMASFLVDKYFGADYGLEEEYGSDPMAPLGSSQSEYPPWRVGGDSSAAVGGFCAMQDAL
eukprot:jgi/Mesen1/603/ME000108S10760